MIRIRMTLTVLLVLAVSSCDHSKTAQGGQQPVFQVRINGGVFEVQSAPESMEMTTGWKYRCLLTIENQDNVPYKLSLAVAGPARMIIPQSKMAVAANEEKTVSFLLQTLRPFDDGVDVIIEFGEQKVVMPVELTVSLNENGPVFGVLEQFWREGPIAEASDRPGQKPPAKGQEYPPKGQGFPPKGQGLPPKGQGLPPKGQGLPPKGQGLPPKGQGLPPKGQGLPPKGQGLPPKGQSLPPKGQGRPGGLPPKNQLASKNGQQSKGSKVKDLSHLVEAPRPDRAVRVKSAMRMMKDLGCQVYRTDITWRVVEQSPGSFQWGRMDWITEALRSPEGGGCRLIAVPGYQPLWLPAEFAGERSGLEVYGRWAQAVVSRYAEQVDYWEVWNEPMVFWLRHPNHKPAKDQPPPAKLSARETERLATSYSDIILAVVRIASETIRRHDPDAVILTPGFADFSHFRDPTLNDFAQMVISKLLAKGLGDHVDAFCVHSYPVGYNVAAPSVWNSKAWRSFDEAADSSSLIRLLDRYNVKASLHCTEFAGFKLPQIASPEEETAAAIGILRNGCILAHQGFVEMICTELYDYDKKVLSYLVRSKDQHKTRGYLAYQKLIAALTGAEPYEVRQIAQSKILDCDYSGLVVKGFRRGSEDILCIWNNDSRQRTIRFELREQAQSSETGFWEHIRFSARRSFFSETVSGAEKAASGKIEIPVAPLDFHIVSCVTENPGFDWLDDVTVR